MYFVVIYSPGANWDHNKSTQELIGEHAQYLQSLFDQNKVVMAGPFSDDSGGVAILQVDSENEARKVVENDPCVRSRVINADLRPWKVFLKK